MPSNSLLWMIFGNHWLLITDITTTGCPNKLLTDFWGQCWETRFLDHFDIAFGPSSYSNLDLVILGHFGPLWPNNLVPTMALKLLLATFFKTDQSLMKCCQKYSPINSCQLVESTYCPKICDHLTIWKQDWQIIIDHQIFFRVFKFLASRCSSSHNSLRVIQSTHHPSNILLRSPFAHSNNVLTSSEASPTIYK